MIKKRLLVLLSAFLMLITTGCSVLPSETIEIFDPADTVPSEIQGDIIDIAPEMVPLTEKPALFTMLLPEASGTDVRQNVKAAIDVSNAKDGYFMVKYMEKTTKALKVLVKGPSGTQYQYTLKSDGNYEVYPFSDGNGSYQIGVYVQIKDSQYSTAHTATVDVKLNDEFAPFLRPNQYVNYNKDSEVVKKAAELTKDLKSVADKIAAVYNFTVKNITYDKELAASVKSGYLPNVDEVMKKGKGICFDYAALMTAMLRSQDIPTKLVVGYAKGDIYHAWLSAYSKEAGWIDTVIYFDGKTWKLMDPTFASSGQQGTDVIKFIGDGSNYSAKYIY